MTILEPEGVLAYGMTTVILAPTIADPETEVVITEANGVGTINASCFLYADVVATTTDNKIDRDRPICRRKRIQAFGEETTEVTDLMYSEDPQGASSTDGNKVKTALPKGTEIYVIERRGLPADTEVIAVDDIVNIYLVEVGTPNRTKSSDGEGGVFTITQSVIHKASYYDVPVVAA